MTAPSRNRHIKTLKASLKLSPIMSYPSSHPDKNLAKWCSTNSCATFFKLAVSETCQHADGTRFCTNCEVNYQIVGTHGSCVPTLPRFFSQDPNTLRRFFSPGPFPSQYPLFFGGLPPIQGRPVGLLRCRPWRRGVAFGPIGANISTTRRITPKIISRSMAGY